MKRIFLALSLLVSSSAPAFARHVKKAPKTIKIVVLERPVAVSAGGYEPNAAERNAKKSAISLGLAQNGKALVPLVIATKASDETKRIASDLASLLERMTGAKFEVQTPDGKPASLAPHERPKIAFAEANAAMVEYARATRALPAEALPSSGLVVGIANEWIVPADLKPALAMDGPFQGKEAFAIRTDDKRLLLLSNTERGFNHAVTRLLEEMGCRWFATGPNWEIVPKTPNLSFGLDITDRPSIGTRIVAFMDGAIDQTERYAQGKWMARNYIGASFGSNVGHNWQAIAEANNDALVEHPEYFAENMTPAGERKRMQPIYTDAKTGKKVVQGVFAKFELTNPIVRKMFVDYALNYFRIYPEAAMVSLSPTDGGNFSTSGESQKFGTISDNVYNMINEVAREVEKAYPGQGKMVGCYAYRETAAPPSFPMEPNVYIEVATLFNMSTIPTEQLLEMWPKVAKNVGVYRYFSYFDAGGSSFSGGPVASINWVKEVVRTDHERNVAALFAQSSNAFAMQMRGYLVATRLMWNPNADVDAILADFYDKAYGPAADVMKRFHEQVSPDSKKSVNIYSLGAAFRLMDEATKKAQGRPDVLARLGDLKMYLRWTHLQMLLDTAPKVAPVVAPGDAPTYDTARYASPYEATYDASMKAAAAMATAYMAQYNQIRRKGGQGAATFKSLKPLEWDNMTVPPLEKIEADFQESLKQLPPREIPEVHYDLTDLVPVVFPPVAPALQFEPNPVGDTPVPDGPMKRRETYQLGSPIYYFYSFGGEPIEVELVGGVRVAGMRPKWTLSRPGGKGDWTVIEKGDVPSDKSVQKLSLPVPDRGIYAFQFNGMNSWGYVDTRLDKPVTLNADSAVDFASPFIYVPKGTKEIWMRFHWAWGGGGDRKLMMPDGKEAQILREGKPADLTIGVYTIPVPEGMDGQLWRWSKNSQFRYQEFFNIPNLAAASPETLMVPRAVALQDGLKIKDSP